MSRLAMANTLTEALTKNPSDDAHSVVSTRLSMKMKNLSAAVSKPARTQGVSVLKSHDRMRALTLHAGR